jgi:tetratricopeptide (TPR) repeat protein
MIEILLSLILFLIPVSNVLPENINDYLQNGDAYFSKFDNKSALDNYLKAYRLAPDNYDVLFRLARTYNDLGEEFYEYRERDSSEIMIKKAVEVSEKMAKDYPDSAQTYAYLAMSYGNQALYEGGKDKIKLAHKIEDNAKKSLQINPDQYLPYVILGIYYRQIADLSWFERMFANTFFGNVPDGSFEQSIQMFNKALKIKPRTIVASFQLALTYKAMGDDQKEKDLLESLINYPEKNFRDKFAIKKAKKRLKELE